MQGGRWLTESMADFENLPRHFPKNIYYLIDYVKRKATPEDILILSDIDNVVVKAECAKRKRCPREVLVKLSQDFAMEVRYSVAMNKKTPKSIIGKLMVDDHPLVQKAARMHEHAKHFVVFD